MQLQFTTIIRIQPCKINGKNCDEQGRNQNVLLKILICEAEMHYPNPTQHITYKTHNQNSQVIAKC